VRTMLKSKLHGATVTEANVDYEGSITIDPKLMKSADLLPYEQVHVLDVDNGERLITYCIEGQPDTGQVCINGAAARLVSVGDKVIVLSYHNIESSSALHLKPRLVYLDGENGIVRIDHRDRVEASS